MYTINLIILSIKTSELLYFNLFYRECACRVRDRLCLLMIIIRPARINWKNIWKKLILKNMLLANLGNFQSTMIISVARKLKLKYFAIQFRKIRVQQIIQHSTKLKTEKTNIFKF